jgi:hypothetical protein
MKLRNCFSILMTLFAGLHLLSDRQVSGQDRSSDVGRIEVEQIEQKVIETRASIKSGQVNLMSIVDFPNGSHRETKYVAYFDGIKYRLDRRDRYHTGNAIKPQNNSSAICDDAFRYLSEETVSFIAPRTFEAAQKLTDVRLLGMYPSSFANLYRYSFNSRIGNHGRVTSIELQTEHLNGLTVKKLTYISDRGTDAVWICPSRDFNIVRMERHNAQKQKVRELAVDLSKVKDFGWFPSKLKLVYYEEDSVEKTETLALRVVQFNGDLPAETWTFRGMGAAVGKQILDRRTGEFYVLDENGF